METAAVTSRQTSPAEPAFCDAPRRPARWCEIVQPIHTLHLYGAAGITAFGWAMARRCGFDPAPLAPLWFCGALLVYNADRLKADPADRFNTPERAARHSRLRKTSAAISVLAAAVLIGLPAARGDWRLLSLVIAAALLSLSYSFPLPGFRFKDVPLVKTLFPPTVVTVACFLPPLLARGLSSHLAVAMAWAWFYLLFNMVLCDLRDSEGDRRAGTKSLPVLFGAKNTLRALVVALLATTALAWINGWFVLAAAAACYLAILLLNVRQPRGEAFYEWFVEGMLFLPLIIPSRL